MSRVTFLTRRRCELCAEALPLVEAACRRGGHSLDVIDVDASGSAGEYGERVPVVIVDGVEMLSGRFRPTEIVRALG